MSNSIAAIVLTYNEELHIERCINSLRLLVDEIFVVDSFSSDRTVQMAKNLGAVVYQNEWKNQAVQINWGLDNLPIQSDWIIRIDADEFLTQELIAEIKSKILNLSQDITGIILKRRVYFMGQWIRWGGYYPIYLLRIWKRGMGKSEERWMDEHICLKGGKTIVLDNDFVDDNQNNITWWIDKHNNYATREAIEMLNIKYKFLLVEGLDTRNQKKTKIKKELKEKVYYKLPIFLRALIYFIYRYIIMLGFLDGKKGLIWHFLQGFWYRFLVDTKIYDIIRLSKKHNIEVKTIIEKKYKIKLNKES